MQPIDTISEVGYAAGGDFQPSPIVLVLVGVLVIVAGVGGLILRDRGLAISRFGIGPILMILVGVSILLLGLVRWVTHAG